MYRQRNSRTGAVFCVGGTVRAGEELMARDSLAGGGD